MEPPPASDPHRSLAPAFAGAALMFGCVGFAGWLGGIELLRRVGSGFPAMHPATAILLVMSGLSLLFAKRVPAAAWVLGVAVALPALARLIDELLEGAAGLRGLPFFRETDLDRMAGTTAASLLLLTAAQFLLLSAPLRFRRPAAVLAVLGGACGFFALTGYLLELGPLYKVQHRSNMALLTALALVLLSLGTLLSAPPGPLAHLLGAQTPLARLSRRLLLVGLTAEVAVALARLGAQAAGYYDRETAIALHVAGSITITLVLLVFALSRLATTERLREAKERELALAQRSLLHLSRRSAMGTMAGTLSHELNQPLAALSMYSSALRRVVGGGQEGQALRPYVDAIGATTTRAGEIIKRMRRIAETGDVAKEPTRLRPLIGDAVSMLMPDHVGVAIRIEVPEDAEIEADPIAIQQVLFNLLRNAFEAVDDRTEGCVRVALEAEGAWQRICIRDNGPGFPQGTPESLFEAGRSTKETGMGVGLSISRTIVEAHGGRLEARHAPPEGAEFCVLLPTGAEA